MNQQGSAEPFLINCCSNREKVTEKENQNSRRRRASLHRLKLCSDLAFEIKDAHGLISASKELPGAGFGLGWSENSGWRLADLFSSSCAVCFAWSSSVACEIPRFQFPTPPAACRGHCWAPWSLLELMEIAIQQLIFKPNVSIFSCLYSPKRDANLPVRDKARKAVVSPLAKLPASFSVDFTVPGCWKDTKPSSGRNSGSHK